MFPNIRKIKSEIVSEVNALVAKNGIGYLEAVILYCEKNNIDIEQAGSIIANNSGLTSKLESEAESLNFLKK